jgi:hypothetical protein
MVLALASVLLVVEDLYLLELGGEGREGLRELRLFWFDRSVVGGGLVFSGLAGSGG